MDHDHNFKNLILDYAAQALAFFAPEEAIDLATARITPLRQEQLKERLGERFRELDVPLLVEWPDGRREAAANPNGSDGDVAGIVDARGTVLGMMPHPERAADPLLGGEDGLVVLGSLLDALAGAAAEATA